MAENLPMTSPTDSLPFSEPHITNLLVVGSFLYFLNAIYGVFQFLFGAGLIGQLVLGAVYAIPLGNILPFDIQTSMGTIGYIGLLLLIVEGGLEARLDILGQRRNLCICVLVGLTGIGLPIGLSMLVLHFGYQYSALESFIVGAALSSTSLGTTFAIISSFQLPSTDTPTQPHERTKRGSLGDTRAGTILIGAALLDDIVGLVITGIVFHLSGQISGWVIARPIVSSFALLLGTAVLAKLVPVILNRLTGSIRFPSPWTGQIPNIILCLFLVVISAYVTVAHYVGSSMLIGAFCAGALANTVWAHITVDKPERSPHRAFGRIAPVQNLVLAPLFFASIGAAIPVRALFRVSTAWRGILYSVLMILAKVLAGTWLPLWSALERRWNGSGPSSSAWPAGLFVGLALVTRGEIGLLILSLARGGDMVGDEAFGVGIWAVVLSTLIGPVGVGRLLQTRLGDRVVQGPWGIDEPHIEISARAE